MFGDTAAAIRLFHARISVSSARQSSPILFLQNVSIYVAETVICRQNSRLYGVNCWLQKIWLRMISKVYIPFIPVV